MHRPVTFRQFLWAGFCLCSILALGAAAQPAAKTVQGMVTIDAAQMSEPISPYIYGQFIEHLGRCIYGGIWAEMLEDRKFYFPVPADGDIWRLTRAQARVLAASPWKVIGPAENVRMTEDDVFVGEHTPELTIEAGTPVGIYQEEFGLIAGQRYNGGMKTSLVIAGALLVITMIASLRLRRAGHS